MPVVPPPNPAAGSSTPVAPPPPPNPAAGPLEGEEDAPVAAAPSPPATTEPALPLVPPPPAQTAALPAIPGGGATPVPDQPHVYGLANGNTRILIRALSDSWIQIRDKDHKPIFTRQLHAGDTYHVPDGPGLTMKTGKGVGLAITVDGRQAPPIGGAVRSNISLDPDRLLAGTALGD